MPSEHQLVRWDIQIMRTCTRFIVCFSLLFSLQVGVFAPRGHSALPETVGLEKPGVWIETAAYSDLAEALTFPARVEANVKVQVASEINGNVVRVLKRIGDGVQPGDTIAMIRNLQTALDYKLYRLVAPKSTPRAGVLTGQPLTIGQRVSENELLAEIIDPTNLRITTLVPQADLTRIQRAVHMTFEMGDLNQPVTLISISPTIDTKTGSAPVTLALSETSKSNKMRLLAPGSYGQVRFELPSHRSITVPFEAVVTLSQNRRTLRLEKNGAIELRDVTLGRIRGERIEILEGLKPGDRIVVKSSSYLKEGDQVTVKENDQ